ncbi:serine hydrolase [Selenomonas sputigena]|uniref:Beta-lactamase class A catalytic domain-containing protein n=1 Tax=Selenomonas sputigena (strain ATCC 35185 / DSM 20758 / CCUG 44933 / VPI D19B-28) TaxID=546271 RepID=C9LUU8_SELS3|nr:serine hydrolase [Selenomonas sputigena]AEC01174.1 hypothetical protein Selsp_2228 [Selenomonas sputigena ATCC 35185]EEX77364.1 hypothetical protein SELSPUOL_01238 [Selenomonas sputigena ATCC 35185]
MNARDRKAVLALVLLALGFMFFLLLLAGGLWLLLRESDNEMPSPVPGTEERRLPEAETPQRTEEGRRALVDEVRRLAARGGAKFTVYLADPDDGNAPLIRDADEMRAASMIKVFILACAMEKVKAGELHLDDVLRLEEVDKVGGAGVITGYRAGTVFSVEELLRQMIAESDNTATNMMIDRLGMTEINGYMRAHGYDASRLQRKMMDDAAVKEGRENITSAKDLGTFFLRLYRSECVGEPYDGKMRDMLFAQTDRECFPQALPGARIAHKTGELDRLYADGGILYGEDGRAVILVILADDIERRGRAIEMMREIARRVMQK